jgi:hypothetical protein
LAKDRHYFYKRQETNDEEMKTGKNNSKNITSYRNHCLDGSRIRQRRAQLLKRYCSTKYFLTALRAGMAGLVVAWPVAVCRIQYLLYFYFFPSLLLLISQKNHGTRFLAASQNNFDLIGRQSIVLFHITTPITSAFLPY